MRQLATIRGIAIVAVLVGHAASWGMIALGWWGARFGDATPTPNWNWIDTPAYYGLMGVHQLSFFSVPAFLVAAGWHVSFVTQGDRLRLTAATLRSWLKNLITPYAIWMLISAVLYLLLAALAGTAQDFDLAGSMKGRLADYYFVPVLAEFFLVSPLLIRLARRPPLLLLSAFAMLDMTFRGENYLPHVGIRWFDPIDTFLGSWGSLLLLGWATYFAFGLVLGLHSALIKPRLKSAKWLLVGLTAALGMLSILEGRILAGAGHDFSNNESWKLSTFLFALVAVCALAAFDWRGGWIVRVLDRLGTHSYGIYLVQAVAIESVARLVYHAAPFVLPYEWILQPLLVGAGLGAPLVLMWAMARSPFWKFQRLVFGGSMRAAPARPQPPRLSGSTRTRTISLTATLPQPEVNARAARM